MKLKCRVEQENRSVTMIVVLWYELVLPVISGWSLNELLPNSYLLIASLIVGLNTMSPVFLLFSESLSWVSKPSTNLFFPSNWLILYF